MTAGFSAPGGGIIPSVGAVKREHERMLGHPPCRTGFCSDGETCAATRKDHYWGAQGQPKGEKEVMSARKLTAFLLLITAGLPAARASASVKVVVPPGLHRVKEAVSVTVRNETTRPVWYCVEVSKTMLHDPAAETGTPVPVFRIKSRKTENEKWGNLVWGPDYGGAKLPEELPPGEERQYNIVLSEAGTYQIELAFREEQMSATDCGQELKGAKRSRSRVFHVSATKQAMKERGALRPDDLYEPLPLRDGNLRLQIPVVATTKPKQ